MHIRTVTALTVTVAVDVLGIDPCIWMAIKAREIGILNTDLTFTVTT